MTTLTPTDSILERVHLIPEELVALPQWAVWRTEHGRKIPYQADGHGKAKCNDRSTWATFDKALQRFARYLGRPDQYSGLMFAISADDPYVGFDFDDCMSGDTIAAPVRELLRKLGGYAEISPSGTGVKCVVRGSLNTTKTGRQTENAPGCKAMEVYHRGRFFTLTGRKVDDYE